MTPDAAGPVEAALAEHWPDWGGEAVVCKCGWSVTYTRPRDTRDLWGMYFAHVAAALAPLFAEHGAAERRAGAVEVAPLIRRAVLDPGAFVKRGPDYDGNAYGERLDQWQDRAIAAAREPEAGVPHVCVVARETATSPTYSGAITVTGWCDECGRAVETHTDWIL